MQIVIVILCAVLAACSRAEDPVRWQVLEVPAAVKDNGGVRNLFAALELGFNTARFGGGPEKSCVAVRPELQLFCWEGAGLAQGMFSVQVPTPENRSAPTPTLELALGSGYGLGLRMGGIATVDALNAARARMAARGPGFDAAVIDGWALGTTLGAKRVDPGLCVGLAAEDEQYACLFGVGRASFFLGSPPVASSEENSKGAMTSGYHFASGFGGGDWDTARKDLVALRAAAALTHDEPVQHELDESTRTHVIQCATRDQHLGLCVLALPSSPRPD